MARRDFRVWQALALTVASLAILAHIVAGRAIWTDASLTLSEALAGQSYSLFDIPFAVLACVIALWGVRTSGVAMLALAWALIALSGGIESLIEFAGLPLVPWGGHLVAAIAAGAFIRAAQLFPKRLTKADLNAPSAPWQRFPLLRRLLAALLVPWAAWVIGGIWALGITNPITELPVRAVHLLLGAAYWYVHYRVGTAKARRRIVWFMQLALVAVLMNVLTFTLNMLFASAGMSEARSWLMIAHNAVLGLACSACIGMAVFAAGAVNPSLIVRATVIYGLAAALLLFLLNVILSETVEDAATALGISDRLAAAALGSIAGLALDNVVQLLRRRFGARS